MARDYLVPSYRFPQKPQDSSAPRETLDRSASKNIQLMCCGDGESIPIVYGTRRLGVKISAVVFVKRDIVLQCVVCQGRVEAIRNICFDDKAATGADINVYLGDDVQVVDPLLAAAFAAQKPAIQYTDTLPNVAYIVVKANAAQWSSMPNITVEVDGFQVFDDRDASQSLTDRTTWKWSDNPSLCLADLFRRNTELLVDSQELIKSANANDELIDGLEKRRTMSLVLDRPQDLSRWVETFRSYAAAWCVPQGEQVCIVPDRPAESVFKFTDEDGEANILTGSFKWGLLDAMDAATVVQVNVTDRTQTPWSTFAARATSPGVLSGALERREKVLQMEGFTSYSQGYREAVEQLNRSLLERFTASWDAFDVAIKLRVGDVITLTYSDIVAKEKMRITSLTNKEVGRYSITARKYDPSVYCDEIRSAPATLSPTLPDPQKPPAPENLVLSEEIFPLHDRTMKSRIRATWDDVSDFPYAKIYYVEVWHGAKLIDSGETAINVYVTSVLEEGVMYIVRVSTRTNAYASVPVQQDIKVLGKELPPPAVDRLTIQQVGEWVLFTWSRVVDIDAIKRYQIRRWPVSSSWERGVIIDEPDALAYRSNSEPVGDWMYGIVAIDQGERLSETPRVVHFKVAQDTNSFFVDDNVFTTPTLENMYRYETRDLMVHHTTSHGDSWQDVFTLAMLNYPKPVNAYHGAGQSSYSTEWWDIGVKVDGQFVVSALLDNDDGVADVVIETSEDMLTFKEFFGTSALTRARFVRVKFLTNGAMTLHGKVEVDITARPRMEAFSGVSSATGATTVVLDGFYFAVKDCSINPQGTTSLVGIASNYSLSETAPNTFEVMVFDSANQQVSAPFTGTFYGISH